MSITFDELEIEPGDDGPGRRRRRSIAVVGAVALVAAAVAVGYGVGRSAGEGDDERITEPAASDATAPTTVAAPTPTAVPEPAAEPADEEPAPVETTGLDGGAADSYLVAGDVATATATRSASGGTGYPAFGMQPMELLAERTTPAGFVMRAHLGETWEHGASDWGAGEWRPAPWCYESGQMRIALTGNGVIDIGSVPWYSEPFNDRAVSSVLLGVVDGQAHRVVVAQTPADTTSVTVTFGDGAVDTATPTNGIALLTVPASMPDVITEGGHSYYADVPADFRVDFEGGATPGVVDSDGTGAWDEPAFRESCQPPPPPLPEAGVQPDDPAAGEAAITTAMTALYDSSERGERDLYVDDPTGVGEARDQVAESGYADAADSADAVVEELVFTSPTEAWFRYRIDSSNGTFAPRYGIAVAVDGAWKITRDTVCQDLALAGGECGGGWQMVRPPSVGTSEEPVALWD